MKVMKKKEAMKVMKKKEAMKATSSGKAAKGKDKGGLGLAVMDNYEKCVLAEYVWLDAHQVPRSKTMSMTCAPSSIEDLRVWNYDGSSTEQAEGHNSELLLSLWASMMMAASQRRRDPIIALQVQVLQLVV